MDQTPGGLPEDRATAVLEAIAPGSTLVAIDTAPGSYSNSTDIVTGRTSAGADVRLVVRRYRPYGSRDRGAKARREFGAFGLLREHGLPAPEPLILDDQGALLGSPGIVTRYVRGSQMPWLGASDAWVRTLAEALAGIHAIPIDPAAFPDLLDADAEAVWFARPETVPDYMLAHPDGTAVWETVRALWPRRARVRQTLVHVDYWQGNVLWDDERIVAVVDLEEAAYGDPAIDVAYCRMDAVLSEVPEGADLFLEAYEQAAGQRVANLGLWELAAAARPMFAPTDWIDTSPRRELFRDFVARALARTTMEG